MNQFGYCERLDAGFWAEPINALSNLFFLISAYFVYRYVKTNRVHKTVEYSVYFLVFLLVCIGFGSFFWHTFARPWSELADVVPITLFIYAYLQLFVWKVLNKPFYFGLITLFVFSVFNYLIGISFKADMLNGSIAYLPALFSLFVLAGLSKGEKEFPLFLKAIFIFMFSLFFRSIDFAVCDIFSMGTHFLWHLLNAYMLYLLAQFVILSNKLR